jgi:hypothetical protein
MNRPLYELAGTWRGTGRFRASGRQIPATSVPRRDRLVFSTSTAVTAQAPPQPLQLLAPGLRLAPLPGGVAASQPKPASVPATASSPSQWRVATSSTSQAVA